MEIMLYSVLSYIGLYDKRRHNVINRLDTFNWDIKLYAYIIHTF